MIYPQRTDYWYVGTIFNDQHWEFTSLKNQLHFLWVPSSSVCFLFPSIFFWGSPEFFFLSAGLKVKHSNSLNSIVKICSRINGVKQKDLFANNKSSRKQRVFWCLLNVFLQVNSLCCHQGIAHSSEITSVNVFSDLFIVFTFFPHLAPSCHRVFCEEQAAPDKVGLIKFLWIV